MGYQLCVRSMFSERGISGSGFPGSTQLLSSVRVGKWHETAQSCHQPLLILGLSKRSSEVDGAGGVHPFEVGHHGVAKNPRPSQGYSLYPKGEQRSGKAWLCRSGQALCHDEPSLSLLEFCSVCVPTPILD